MDFIISFIDTFWHILLEMSPWLLLGFLFAGLLHAFFPLQITEKHLGKNNFSAAIKAAIIGVPMPLCSCGVIPTAISLQKNGASQTATQSFLISTPQTGIDSMLATYALLGLPFAIIRPIFAFFSGIFGGCITSLFYKDEQKTNEQTATIIKQKVTFKKKIYNTFHYGFVTMIADIAKWLLIGLVLATIITMLVPDDFFADYMSNVWIEFFIVLLISIPLYVCATGSIPVAVSLLVKGISPGAAFLFLMAGPATNVATILVIERTLGRKFLWIYLLTIIVLGIFFGWLINTFLPQSWFSITVISQGNTMNHSIISMICAIILSILIAYSFIKQNFNFIKKITMTENKIINVEGMTCNHCKMNVEKNVQKIQGIKNVIANINDKTVTIEGEANWEEVKNTISELGYQVKEE